ncbi:MAG TPA: GNAT family protein [Chloroflexia bacterium]|nr:GNAT family protein [Chloroflexia bacterium]
MDRASGLTPFPTLETERLVLRRPRMEDAADVFEYRSDPEVIRTVTFDLHVSIEDSQAWLQRTLERAPAESGACVFALELKSSGKMIGTCGIFLDDVGHARAGTAYVLNRAYWGQGLTTEALRAVVDLGFLRLGFNRIFALCLPENVASARVMEKVGMIYEGILREYLFFKGGFHDVEVHSILRREWGAGREA